MEMSSDLLTIGSAHENMLVSGIISSHVKYSNPVYPGYYHMGFYQDQAAEHYYQMDGGKM
jgi:hypothetical protein